tara:strand:+ start:64 stop:501 length:438 start_codon:yes stop_codon:yes gene_type:complete
MIREINEDDLNDEYFNLLSQLSGVNNGHDWERLMSSYIDMKPDIMTFVKIDYSIRRKRIIGSATVFIENKFLHCGSRVGHIEDVVVDKGCRIKGVGKSLIEACLRFAKDKGCYKTILDCSEHNIPFYEKCGFKVDGVCMRINKED